MSTAVTQPMPIVDDRVEGIEGIEGIEDSVEDGGSLTAAAEAFAAPDARTLSDVHIAEPPSSAPGRGSREARDAAAGVYRFTADAGDAAEARRKKKRPSTP